MKSVGIVGGLGPETTAEFYLELIKKFRNNGDSYPSIIIDNVPFPFHLERDIIQNSVNEGRLLPFLKESIKRLNYSRVDFIAIPCNTVHIFIDELRKESRAPILSIIDETISAVKENNLEKVGLLATAKTIESKLYEIPVENNGIKVILPEKDEQEEISRIIVQILENRVSDDDINTMEAVIRNLKGRGSEAIVLGCTDLQLVLKNDFGVQIIDSMEILLESVYHQMNH
ncbi:MAG: amino acid racemase [Candidatus Aenigmarchaeota archaeon]|nr:amino acid racemase [Candidatus Aenigmarchaeota archaeon]